MRKAKKERGGKVMAMLLLVLGGVFAFAPPPACSREVAAEADAPGRYASLPNLVVLIGTDAAARFSGFFDAGPVRVSPFPVLGEFPARRVSLLGATLADQMTAMINSIPGAPPPAGGEAAGEQLLRGLIQEIDGYLRVHVSGRNSRGEWRSYVANVEMSEAVYRAMHTYVSYER